MINIYHTHSGYNEYRNFLYLTENKHQGILFKKEYDWYKIRTHLTYIIQKKVDNFRLNQHLSCFPHPPNTVFHFFNGISHGKTPWICSFEKNLPRFGPQYESHIPKGINAIASPYCKKIIAISNCAANWEKQFIEIKTPKSIADEINSKMIIMHPPQKKIIDSIEEKRLSYKKHDTLTFTFVGNQFFRKGGREILKAFLALPATMRFRLNIVSILEPDTYASATNDRDAAVLKERIKTLPSNFQFYSNIPNTQVIELLKKSHIALLPTYADTYGYFTLEAQACGCPVITTNVEAMPEINNDECGWVIPIELDNLKNAILRTEKNRIKASETIEKNLYQILISIFNNPETILPKANESLNRIRKFHDPTNHASQLMKIYSSAVLLNQ